MVNICLVDSVCMWFGDESFAKEREKSKSRPEVRVCWVHVSVLKGDVVSSQPWAELLYFTQQLDPNQLLHGPEITETTLRGSKPEL